ncbi:MAG: lysophospholipid acyltransferase family protein [Cloacibacillus sp.]
MDKKVKAFLAFAHRIKPGWSANALAGLIIPILRLSGVRKDIALRNIALCFPEKSRQERAAIFSSSCESMIWTGVEMLAWQKDPSLIDRMAVECEHMERIDEALAAGRGAVVFSAHLGSWEFSAAWLARHYPFYGIVRHSDSPFMKELIETLRGSSGLRTISKEENMMRVVSLLRRNNIFGALGDQHGGGEGEMIPFFGEPTSTVCGPAAFSVLTGAPMIPFFTQRLAPFKFKIRAEEPIAHPVGMKRDDAILYLTKKMNEAYEKMIRENPGQWLWQHRRFREIITD